MDQLRRHPWLLEGTADDEVAFSSDIALVRQCGPGWNEILGLPSVS